MDDEHERARQRQERQDRNLRVRPQASDDDQRRGREDEHPGRDAHDAVVGRRRDAAVDERANPVPDETRHSLHRRDFGDLARNRGR